MQKLTSGQFHNLFKQSVDYIGRAYLQGRVDADDAIRALQEKERQIKSRVDNQEQDGSFHLLTPTVRRKIENIDWAIQRIMANEKTSARVVVGTLDED